MKTKPFFNAFIRYRPILALALASFFGSPLIIANAQNCNWTTADRYTLTDIASDVHAMCTHINATGSGSWLWYLSRQDTFLKDIDDSLSDPHGTLSDILSTLRQIQSSSANGCNWDDDDSMNLSDIRTVQLLLRDYMNRTISLDHNAWRVAPVAVTNDVLVHLGNPSVSVTNFSDFAYDDLWIKRYLTGRDDGDNIYPPVWKTAGQNNFSGGDANQNLQTYLSYTLGTLFDNTRTSANLNFEQAFDAERKYSITDHTMGKSYQMFTFWLAQAMRRVLATNQLVATSIMDQTSVERENVSTNQLIATLVSQYLDELRQAEQSGSNWVETTTSDLQEQASEDDEAQDSALSVFDDPEPPEMEGYSYADEDISEADDTVQIFPQQTSPSHSTVLTLLAPSDAFAATGTRFTMEYSFLSNPSFSSWIRSMDNVMSVFWYALTGVYSVYLVLRTRNEVSSIMTGAATHRV